MKLLVGLRLTLLLLRGWDENWHLTTLTWIKGWRRLKLLLDLRLILWLVRDGRLIVLVLQWNCLLGIPTSLRPESWRVAPGW